VSSSSDDEEETMDTTDKVSLNRILEELQNTQVNLRSARTENRDTQQQLVKLTHKLNHFNSFVLSVTKSFNGRNN